MKSDKVKSHLIYLFAFGNYLNGSLGSIWSVVLDRDAWPRCVMLRPFPLLPIHLCPTSLSLFPSLSSIFHSNFRPLFFFTGFSIAANE